MYQALVTLKALGNPYYQTIIKKCLYCPRKFKDDDKDMLEHVKQCLLKAQFCNEEFGDERDKGIDKEQLKDSFKPRIMEALKTMKSHLFDDVKPYAGEMDMSELYDSLKVIDGCETQD